MNMKSFKLSCVLCLPLFFMSCAKDKAAAEEVVSEFKKFAKCMNDKVYDYTSDERNKQEKLLEKSINVDELANNCTKQELKSIQEVYASAEKECQKIAKFSKSEYLTKYNQLDKGKKTKMTEKCLKSLMSTLLQFATK